MPCAPGTYTSVNGSIACSECEAGKYQDEAGATGCKSCSSNSESPPGAQQASACTCKGGYIRLRDLARLEMGQKDYRYFSSINGGPAAAWAVRACWAMA